MIDWLIFIRAPNKRTCNEQNQGRRHGFESGGTILNPHFLASGGTKYCLDSLVSLIRMFAALTLV